MVEGDAGSQLTRSYSDSGTKKNPFDQKMNVKTEHGRRWKDQNLWCQLSCNLAASTYYLDLRRLYLNQGRIVVISLK